MIKLQDIILMRQGVADFHGKEVQLGKVIANPYIAAFNPLEEDAPIEEKAPCWKGYEQRGTKMKDGNEVPNCVPVKEDVEDNAEDNIDEYCPVCLAEVLLGKHPEQLGEAEYRGRKIKLGKIMRGDVKKFKVFVKDPKTGNTKKVNFGDPNMKIKKYIPARRKSFRARHNCDNPGPRTKARYWACRTW
jgi:hypothetical protein